MASITENLNFEVYKHWMFEPATYAQLPLPEALSFSDNVAMVSICRHRIEGGLHPYFQKSMSSSEYTP